MKPRPVLFAAIAAAFASVAAAQPPRIHDFDFYGLQKVTQEKILRVLKLKAGDPLPASKGDMEDRIAKIPEVVRARVEAVCCEGKDVSLFIGIEERGGPHVAFRSDPSGDATLTEVITGIYGRFLTAGKATRDSGIYADQFADYAKQHMRELGDVLRTGAEPQERAIAAAVLGYAPDQRDAVPALQFGLQDPDESVRANTIQALRRIALVARKHPDRGIRISPTWLIELLNSIVLNDRVQATDALITLTDQHDTSILDQIRDRALPSLVEMARWDNLTYALPPFLLVGRIAGLSEEETQSRWSKGEREPVIEKALASVPDKQ